MKKISLLIAKLFIKNYEDVNNLKVRSQYGSLEGWASIIINIILFIIKLMIGLSIKSISLIADAFHTLADTATSIVVIIGFKIAKKPSDKEHPFGHGRMESVATLIVSVLLFITGFEFLEQSIKNIITPNGSSASIFIIILICITIIIKELLTQFSFELGDFIDSKTLKADALHHRSDVFATALVVVALISSRFGYFLIDGIMGVFVSFIIIYSAYTIAKDAINPLLGEAPSIDTIKKIKSIAKQNDRVLGIHDIIYHKYGQTSIISLHIEVSDKETANGLHELSEIVEETIEKEMNSKVIVHIDPINKDHPQYETIENTIKKIIKSDKRVHSFHELRIVGCKENKCNVVFDIALEEDTDEQSTYDIINSISSKFKSKFPNMKTIIKAEPKYSYNI